MDGLAEQATRGGVTGRATTVRKRVAHEVTVQIMARLANAIHVCLQPPKGDAARILHGAARDGDDDDDDANADAETQRPAAPPRGR
eukprot:9066258-Lingulodinium_polyedra.AAC.1